MGRKAVDRTPIFRMIALNYDKRKIKRETGISERTYWMVKKEWDAFSEAEKEELRKLATQDEQAKARFEDYEIVQKWLARMNSDKIKSWKTLFNYCKQVWIILQKKDPKNWTLEDIKLRAIPELRKGKESIFMQLVALRSLRPDFKFPNAKGEVLSTKREKAKVNIAWKHIYQRIIQEDLIQKFFESARVGSEQPLRDETIVRTHVNLGCREGLKGLEAYKRGKIEEEYIGGILGIRWEKINWNTKTIDVYESKTGGGFYWLDCPLDLFGDKGFNMLREYWEECGKPSQGRIFPITYDELSAIYQRIGKALNIDIRPHFSRKLHASLLRHAGVKLEVVSGDAPHGIVGVGWEDLSTLKKFYIAFAQEDIKTAREKARQLEL